MKKYWILAAGALLAFSGTFLSSCINEPNDETTLVHAGQMAPDFTVTLWDFYQGGSYPVSLSDWRESSVVLLTFIDTTCPTCQAQMRQMQTQIIDRFAGKSVQFLPIAREGTRETVTAFGEELGLRFPIGLDPDRAIYHLYATLTVPRNFVIDRTGKVQFSSLDYNADILDQIVGTIEAALQ